ncbi:MAG: hypothetical protein J6Q78_03980 [Clostridia bacterium]|nr:hypothetical protein [Clostridia bacterium]
MKNRTKTSKVAILLVCLMLVMLLLNSCGGLDYDFDEVHDVTDEFIDAVIENDKEEAYELTKNIYAEKDFLEIYNEYREMLKNVEEYELEAIESNTEMDNGSKKINVLYVMEVGEEKFVVDATVSSTNGGLNYIYINEYDDAVKEEYIVVLTYTAPSYIFRLILFAELAFLIIVIVDCARHKIKRKALWLVIIILGNLTVIFSGEDGGLFARFNLLEILGTYLNTYSDNSFEMGISIPIGAIVYLIMRKKLFREWKKEQALKEEKELRAKRLAEERREDERL